MVGGICCPLESALQRYMHASAYQPHPKPGGSQAKAPTGHVRINVSNSRQVGNLCPADDRPPVQPARSDEGLVACVYRTCAAAAQPHSAPAELPTPTRYQAAQLCARFFRFLRALCGDFSGGRDVCTAVIDSIGRLDTLQGPQLHACMCATHAGGRFRDQAMTTSPTRGCGHQ